VESGLRIEESFLHKGLGGETGGKRSLGDLGVDGWIILGWIARMWDVFIWAGLDRPRIDKGGGRL